MQLCQCPTRANHHFYAVVFAVTGSNYKCQCPTRANHHFYFIKRKENMMNVFKSVNALHGRTIISTDLLGTWIFWKDKACQCPTRANHHFYLRRNKLMARVKRVSMPYTGEPSFLRYPLKNGLFTPFFEGVYASIFQNILKISQFTFFFVLFTVCSYFPKNTIL